MDNLKLSDYIAFVVGFPILIVVWDYIIVQSSDLTWQEGIVTAILMTCGTIATFDGIRRNWNRS